MQAPLRLWILLHIQIHLCTFHHPFSPFYRTCLVLPYSRKYSIGTLKYSATFFRLFVRGKDLPHRVIVAFPKPHSFSNFDIEMFLSLHNASIFSRIKYTASFLLENFLFLYWQYIENNLKWKHHQSLGLLSI